MSGARVRQDGEKVQLFIGGKLHELPWEAALELSAALRSVGKLAEAEAKHEGIILDTAILHRAGVPMGFSDDPRVKAEAKKEAQWGKLRKYMPMPSIPSREVFGTPTLKQG